MRVGLYSPGIDKPIIKGPTKYQVNLVRALGNIENVELYIIHHSSVYPFKNKAQHIIIKEKTPVIWETKLKKYHLDIIHFNDIPTMYRSLSPFLLTCKKIVTVHGDLHWIKEIFPEYNNIKYRIRRLMELTSNNFTDIIISVSNDLKKRLIQHLRIPESKIKVIHEGVSPAYKPLKNVSHVLEKYGIVRHFILHVSNLAPKKNPYTLFKAFSLLVKQKLNVDLVIAGGRWDNIHITNIIKMLNLTAHAKMLGYVPEKDLICLYNVAELFVFPSIHETFGLPVLEAMACGTPVIASNAYSIPEVAGNAAILCNPYDYKGFAKAMRQVLEDAELKKKLRIAGLKNVKKFSWEKCALETFEVYKQLLTSK